MNDRDVDKALETSLPCPYCGNERLFYRQNREGTITMFGEPTWKPITYHICCRCGASGKFEDSLKKATDSWNKVAGERRLFE